jgi:excisionase family DNA binding protein
MSIPVLERLAVTPSQAAEVLGVCRRTIHGLIGARKLKAYKAGHRTTLIEVASLRAYLEGLPVRGSTPIRKHATARDRGRA